MLSYQLGADALAPENCTVGKWPCCPLDPTTGLPSNCGQTQKIGPSGETLCCTAVPDAITPTPYSGTVSTTTCPTCTWSKAHCQRVYPCPTCPPCAPAVTCPTPKPFPWFACLMAGAGIIAGAAAGAWLGGR